MPSPPTTDLTTLITPPQIHHLFRHNPARAAHWREIFSQLWDSASQHPHTLDPNADAAMTQQQAAHGRLVSLTQAVRRVTAKHRRAKENAATLPQPQSKKQLLVLQQQQQHPKAQIPPPATDATTQHFPNHTPTPAGPNGYVDLATLPSSQRSCTMCQHPHQVLEHTAKFPLRHYPVQLSCAHLVCYSCAKVMLRMHLSCGSCCAGFGDGKAEMGRVEGQIASLKGIFNLVADEGDDVEVQGSDPDGFDRDDVSLTREDVEAALTLLNLAGREFEMEDVECGLALLDLRAGTDTTVEEYLMTIVRG